jgi:hypothetical protein
MTSEYNRLIEQNKRLIEILKPYAFMWQNKQTNMLNWKDCYKAQRALIDIMGVEKYLKEVKEARDAT